MRGRGGRSGLGGRNSTTPERLASKASQLVWIFRKMGYDFFK